RFVVLIAEECDCWSRDAPQCTLFFALANDEEADTECVERLDRDIETFVTNQLPDAKKIGLARSDSGGPLSWRKAVDIDRRMHDQRGSPVIFLDLPADIVGAGHGKIDTIGGTLGRVAQPRTHP